MMTVKGAVQCRAYVHGKATVGDAVNALKQDIVRSVMARCEIHCEDLLLIEEEQKATSTLILPDVMEDRLSEFGDTPTHSTMNMYIPIAGVVATVAVGLASYMMGFNAT
ncbi:unnamed protein product [Larinioides sclopetarius]